MTFLGMARRLMIFTLIWVGALSLFYLMIWRPGIREIEALEKQLSVNRNSLSMIRQHIERSPRLTEEMLQKAEESLELFLSRIPSERDVPDMLGRIRKLGVERHKLRISSLSDETGEEKGMQPDEYSKAIYRLTAKGNLKGIIEFLADLESSERLISVESFSIKRDDEEPNSVNLDLMFAVFYSPLIPEVMEDEKAR
jgi:Tfp pilus assembly protein PilO